MFLFWTLLSSLRNSFEKSDVIACLFKAGFKLSIVINLSETDSVFFFIIDRQKGSQDIRQLNKQVAGLGLKDSLSPFQPIVKRRKSSFFRSFNDRASLKRRMQRSLKRKFGFDREKVRWFQQTCSDSGTDGDYENIEEEEQNRETSDHLWINVSTIQFSKLYWHDDTLDVPSCPDLVCDDFPATNMSSVNVRLFIHYTHVLTLYTFDDGK